MADNPNIPAANDEGFLHSLATSLGLDPESLKTAAKAIYENPVEAAKTVGSEIADEASTAIKNPMDSAKDVGRGVAAQAGVNPDAQAVAKQRFAQPGLTNKAAGALEYISSGIPLLGGNLVKAEEQGAQGNLAGSAGTTVGTVAPLLTEAEPVQAAKTHLIETGKTFVQSAKEGLSRAAEATAPEGSLEAGFAKIGGKKARAGTPKPQVEPKAEEPEEQFHETLARRGQLPGQTVNMSEAMGDTGKYVGGLTKSKVQQVAEAAAPTTPSATKKSEYHPNLQKIADRFGTHEDPTKIADGPSFITPDGKFINLQGTSHDSAIDWATGSPQITKEVPDNRVPFINNSKAVRIRPTQDKAGTTLHISVPKEGISPEQIDSIKQGVSKGLGYGNVMLETADNPRDIKTVYKDLATDTDIEPMLKEIGAHPDQTERLPVIKDLHVPEERTTGKYDDPIKRGGAVPGGIQAGDAEFNEPDAALFHDPKTGSTLALPVDKITSENVKAEIQKSRAQYIAAEDKAAAAKKEPELKVTTDNNGIKWAEDANGLKVSVPKRVADEDIQSYAVDKIKEQVAGQAAVKVNRIEPNETLQASAQKYAKKQGMEPINHEPVKVDTDRAKEIAKIYDEAKHDPNDPRVKSAYDAMKKETLDQFHHLRDDLGLKFEPQEKDPYQSAGEMMGDVKQNNRLKVFTGSSTGADHPLSEVAPGTGGHTYNTIFRWVHDAMGHAAGGNDFSEAGEKSATEAHAQMYSDAARPAMRAETEGQTSWFFHNPEVESGAKKPGEFAEQKATILPDTSADWHEKAGESAAKNEAGGINPRTGKSDSKGMGAEIMPELRQPLDHAPTAPDFKNFYDQHKDIFAKHPELRVGWDNKSAAEGGHEINVGAVGPDAARVAKKLDQKSAFNITKGEVVPTGGAGLRTSFPNYPIEERIKDLTNQLHSDRPGFEHLSEEIYKNLQPDERKYVEGNKTLQRNVMTQYHKIAPSVAETTNAMQAGATLSGWWQRYIDTFHGLLDTDAEKVANTIGPSHAEVLKQWHAALSANKSVQDANNIAWHTYADWLDAGKPTDRKSINDIVLKNGAQPEGSGKKGNAAISDTLGKRGKIEREGIDTSKLFNLVNSPEMRGERLFSGDVFNDDDAKNPLMGSSEGYRKVPSMGATVAGKGNLNRLVIDTHIADFYGQQSNNTTAARYIADSAHLRQAAKALGLKGGEGQEQLWGTVLGLKTLLKEGLTPAEAGSKLDAETINKIGKDYAEVIANDPEITKPGGVLDRLKEKYGIGVGAAGASAQDIAARSTGAGEGGPTGSQTPVNPSLLGESAQRIRGQISDSKIKKPSASPEDEDTSFNFGANVAPKAPKPSGKSSKTMSALELIQALSGLSKPGTKK